MDLSIKTEGTDEKKERKEEREQKRKGRREEVALSIQREQTIKERKRE